MAEIAERQRGLVTRQQLLTASLTAKEVRGRVERGQLHPIHRGVYTVGTPLLLPGARELAAVLACRDGIWVHHVGRFHPSEVGEIDEIPCTSPARTILDLAGRLDDDELEQLVAEAHAQRAIRKGELEALLTRHRRRRGIAPLRSLLDSHAEPKRTRSKAERRMLRLIRKSNLPEPKTNAKIAGHEVDLLWPDHKLVVEFDGFRFHSSRRAFEQDRRRDQSLVALGYRVVRITWLQLTREPDAVVTRIAGALSQTRRRASAR